jgi:predicted amidophosphoribosyltransferase
VGELAALVALDPAAGARRVCATPAVPAGAARALDICPACLGLTSRQGRHACPLRDAGLVAAAVGWGTPTSTALGAAVRGGDAQAMQLTATLLADAFGHRAGRSVPAGDMTGRLVVPVPTKVGRDEQALLPLARALAGGLGAEAHGLLRREKRRSTRGSLAQERSRIAGEEYTVVGGAPRELVGAEVILVDDRITTGHTAAGVGRLLIEAGASHVEVLVLDRTVSPRVLQRLKVSAVTCEHPFDPSASFLSPHAG